MPAGTPPQSVRATGNAPIVKQGHTSNDQHGSNVNAKPLGRKPTRNLNVK